MSKRSSSITTSQSRKGSKRKPQVTFAPNDDDEDMDDDDDDDDDEIGGTSSNNNRSTTSRVTNHNGLELCDVPTFQLPSLLLNGGGRSSSTNGSNNNDRYELWTIRLPPSMNLQDMNDFEIPINAVTAATTDDTTAIHALRSSNGTSSKYQFQLGQPVENDSFRLLTSATSTTNHDNNNEPTSSKTMIPSSMTFQKHFNIVMIPTTTTISTTSTRSPQQIMQQPQQQLRHAYAPVPQKTGLKRRWAPFGTPKNASIAFTTNQKVINPKQQTEAATSSTNLTIEANDSNTNKANGKEPDHITATNAAIKQEDNGTSVNATSIKRRGATKIELKVEETGQHNESTPVSSKKSKKRKHNNDDTNELTKSEKKAMKKERKKAKKMKKE